MQPGKSSDGDAARGLDETELTTVALGPTGVEGSVIDYYHFIQKIGEGGMGEVWLAEQMQPVRRRVAVKLLKAGMNSREVIARFESERQALALMNHPAIAKVLDAGSTPQAAPFFVMEYVAGSAITTYCDEHKLNTRERLEIFMQVCEGVQHAHHKAIIHRDLKPSNILITEVDGQPMPKIIDFGVAKALSQALSPNPMLTLVGTLIGTPEYMSPEQANSSGEDIDTRTDVYSLGVVFYELLAGARPLDFKKAALHEFLKQLREEEPPKPSTSIRTRTELAKTELTNTHRTALPTLEREIRGDLDAIALKALEKDRSRRYSTPSDFAADIRRYLNHEAVLAVRPSAVYRARKFARRYRVALATAAAFLIVLVAAAVISIRQSIRANREAATARAISDFLQNDLLVQVNPSYQEGPPDPDPKVRTLLDRAASRVSTKFKNQPAVEASIRHTIARAYNGLGDFPRARANLERSVELFRNSLGPDDPETLDAENLLALAQLNRGDVKKAEALLLPAFKREQRVLGREHRVTLAGMLYLSNLKASTGHLDEAVAIVRELIELEKRIEGPEHYNTLVDRFTLASLMYGQRKYGEAEEMLQQLVEIDRRVAGPSSASTHRDLNLLAQAYSIQGKFKEAENVTNEVVEDLTRTLGPEHASTLVSMTILAKIFTSEKRYPEAEALHLKILDIKRRVLGPRSLQAINSLGFLATLYTRQEKYGQAENYAREALAGRRQLAGPKSRVTIDAAADLATVLIEEGKFSAAEPLSREACEWDERNRPDRWERFSSKALLGASLAGEKKFAEAEPLLLEGYEGMRARKHQFDPGDLVEIDRAARWIVNFYDAWGKPNQAAKWRQNLSPAM